MQYRTDLAMERAADVAQIQGVQVAGMEFSAFSRRQVDIEGDEAAQRLQKPKGRYVTFHTPPLRSVSHEQRLELARCLSESVRDMLPPFGDVLVVGLGNRRITSDALGSRAAEAVLVTRHMLGSLPESLKGRLRGVCALTPGVLGVTGMETADMVRGAVEHTLPSAVIAIDALAARECARIGTTLQLTNTGILPGSGVGNHRVGLTRETLGIPVLALGVPTVVYSGVIVRDALEILLKTMQPGEGGHEAAADALAQKLTDLPLGEMVVTPREVDETVSDMAQLIGLGLNMALQPRLSPEEITLLTNDGV